MVVALNDEPLTREYEELEEKIKQKEKLLVESGKSQGESFYNAFTPTCERVLSALAQANAIFVPQNSTPTLPN